LRRAQRNHAAIAVNKEDSTSLMGILLSATGGVAAYGIALSRANRSVGRRNCKFLHDSSLFPRERERPSDLPLLE
jgi:hypothetical protein